MPVYILHQGLDATALTADSVDFSAPLLGLLGVEYPILKAGIPRSAGRALLFWNGSSTF